MFTSALIDKTETAMADVTVAVISARGGTCSS